MSIYYPTPSFTKISNNNIHILNIHSIYSVIQYYTPKSSGTSFSGHFKPLGLPYIIVWGGILLPGCIKFSRFCWKRCEARVPCAASEQCSLGTFQFSLSFNLATRVPDRKTRNLWKGEGNGGKKHQGGWFCINIILVFSRMLLLIPFRLLPCCWKFNLPISGWNELLEFDVHLCSLMALVESYFIGWTPNGKRRFV